MREKSCLQFPYCKIHWIFMLFLLVMELNIRPGTSDVGYAKRVVKTLAVKGSVGIFICTMPILFWIWKDLGHEQFYVTRDSTPKVWAVSLALIIETANGYAMHSRVTAYSLFTRCVWNTPVHLGGLTLRPNACLVHVFFLFIQFGRFATTSELGLCNVFFVLTSNSLWFCITFRHYFLVLRSGKF